jgi:hypothetical protein
MTRARNRYVARLTAYLQSDHAPRLEMSAVLGITGLAGFFTSVLLLRAGMTAMWLRYPLCAAAAYGVFLVLVWNLVRIYREEADRALAGEAEAPAGASGDDDDDSHILDAADPTGCLDVPGDEGCAVVAALALVFCLGIAAVYFVTAAPVLLAELVLDSLLVGGLYRRLRREDQCRWFVSALRRTVWPAVAVLVFLAFAGIAFSAYAPEARSIGDVLEKWLAEE